MISVIIPVYNGQNVISNCLKALLNQNYPKNKYEIIVVDDGSTDDTVEIFSKFKKVRLIKQKHSGPAVARNFGASKSKGDILLFTDADCVQPKDWVRNMIEPFKDEEIAGVSGTYKTLNKGSLIARFAGYEIEERHKSLSKKRFLDFIGTFSAGYRKKIFQKYGGFDTSFATSSGEDPELSFRMHKAGFKMVFQPKAFVYHRHPDSLYKFLKQKFWRGYWRVLTYKKHKDKIFRHSYTPKSLFVEEAITGITLFSFILSFFNLLPILYAQSFFLLMLLLTLPFSIKVFSRDKIVGLFSPIIIILRNSATGFGIICGALNFLSKK